MNGKPQLKIKVQIHCGDEIAMGPGKADLLEAIREHGSISAAGRAMDMSYRRAWLLVDAMNRCWDAPLVHTSPGRAQGSGARLTEMGEQVLAHYRALLKTLHGAAQDEHHAVLAQLLLPQPRASQKA
ncbi:molybdate transport system regulatory protein [Novosphingobium sp. CF614]|uniref:winged helix-turn-helix domain-containing protein n=1 Tax=Novosphingobium sp. CF614 TaxID=1884364 RepID=UPI0008E0A3D6|nr:LysR family transcriptional regulator [Novosphingobium sp. CF614]SFF84188.1 molybdate transport system regulatory protein [Novosphingobium sp. CF614]